MSATPGLANLSYLTNLRSLSLCAAGRSVCEEKLPALPTLTSLYLLKLKRKGQFSMLFPFLTNCNIESTDFSLECLRDHPRITDVHVYDRTSGIDSLLSLASLSSLSIARYHLDISFLAASEFTTRLRTFSLEKTLRENDLESLRNLSALTSLIVCSHDIIEPVRVEPLRGLSNLEHLESKVRVNSAEMKWLHALPHLTSLNISDAIDLKTLVLFRRLTKFVVREGSKQNLAQLVSISTLTDLTLEYMASLNLAALTTMRLTKLSLNNISLINDRQLLFFPLLRSLTLKYATH